MSWATGSIVFPCKQTWNTVLHLKSSEYPLTMLVVIVKPQSKSQYWSTHSLSTCLGRYSEPVHSCFDGINPRSVVVLDDAPIHHLGTVTDFMEAARALVRFLPPYSPDLKMSGHVEYME